MSRDFTPQERALLERLCEGIGDDAEIARAQLKVAQHGGLSHGGDDNCFEIEVPAEVPLIAQPDGSLFSLVVYEGDEPIGLADIWISKGRLSFFEHGWFTDDVGPLPQAEQLRPNTMT